MYYKKMHRKHLCRKKRTTQLSTHPVTPRNLCHRCPVDRDWCTCLQCLWDSSTLRDRWGARWCPWHSQPRRGRSIHDLDTVCSCPRQAGSGTLLEPDWDLVTLLCLLGCSFVTAIKAVLNSQTEWVFFPVSIKPTKGISSVDNQSPVSPFLFPIKIHSSGIQLSISSLDYVRRDLVRWCKSTYKYKMPLDGI